MNPEQLQSLLSLGESLTREFKRDAPIADNELAAAAACLANTEGGWLILGAEDDGQISGLHPTHLPVNPYSLQALINNKTVPSVQVQVHIVQMGSQVVAALEVDKSSQVVALSDGRIPKRYIGGQGQAECRFLQPYELASRLAELQQVDYSAQAVSSATWDDLNPLEFERLRQTIRLNLRADKNLLELPNQELAQALGLVKSTNQQLVPTIAGLLLVGRQEAIEQKVPTHEAAFQVLSQDQSVLLNEFSREPLLKLFERLELLLQPYNPQEELSLGLLSIPVPLFPSAAYREAVANALVHRDYARMQAVYIQLVPDAGGLVISSPGGLVDGVNLNNLLVVEPRPRNRTLADAFKRLGLVERTGRGVDRIFLEVLSLGRQPPDYSGTTSDSVRLLLPSGKADLGFVKLISELKQRGQKLGWPHLLVLRQTATEGELSVAETALLTQQNEARARSLLEEMVEMGLLEPKGAKRSRVYHLSIGMYQRMGKPSAYVHRQGVDRMRQEEMVLRFIQRFGQVRREDVLQLLPQLTARQASELLRRMVQEGKLKPSGSKKGRSYQ